MNSTLNDYVWVYIGCGGTFYQASPYLSVLQQTHGAGALVLTIDPDKTSEDGGDRQWPRWHKNFPKANLAVSVLGRLGGDNHKVLVEAFSETSPELREATDGKPVLAIVNVDNDECRLDVARWLSSRVADGIMLVSGCSRTYGQCYPGVWRGGRPIYDWRKLHTDVGEPEEAGVGGQCNLQTVRANALTGVCVGQCLEDIAMRVDMDNWYNVKEFHWSAENDTLSMDSALERCQRRSEGD